MSLNVGIARYTCMYAQSFRRKELQIQGAGKYKLIGMCRHLGILPRIDINNKLVEKIPPHSVVHTTRVAEVGGYCVISAVPRYGRHSSILLYAGICVLALLDFS